MKPSSLDFWVCRVHNQPGTHSEPLTPNDGYHNTKDCTKSLSQDMGERKGNTSTPSLMTGEGSPQPSSTHDPTKISGDGQTVQHCCGESTEWGGRGEGKADGLWAGERGGYRKVRMATNRLK